MDDAKIDFEFKPTSDSDRVEKESKCLEYFQ